MINFPNAKINIGLFITEKRPDGFHSIETIMTAIPLYDAIEIIETTDTIGDFEFVNYGTPIDCKADNNLIVKALTLLKSDFAIPPIRIFLQKNIPFGAGLGGGSADAAFMLKLLNNKFQLHLSVEAMQNYAKKLGSDCAFFVTNHTTFAHGRGDIFEPINLHLSNYQLVLIVPAVHVRTADAYTHVQPHKAPFDLRFIDKIDIWQWKDCIINDFETSVFQQYPQLQQLKTMLYEVGAVYASMSGSGSALYGIFEKPLATAVLEQIDQFLVVHAEDATRFVLDLQ
ncbi:4-diphosphocytidyl-2-C-methyl-D-erythritol kinase [Bacteroidia bacterium]|nr:4-diphosphocytidyl-2-C-methyl-D-erythritol kinase [Bacteroidia bacterium]